MPFALYPTVTSSQLKFASKLFCFELLAFSLPIARLLFASLRLPHSRRGIGLGPYGPEAEFCIQSPLPSTLFFDLALDFAFSIQYPVSSNQHHIHIHHVGPGGSGDHQVSQGLQEVVGIVAPEVV
jgi:hypothetical protein